MKIYLLVAILVVVLVLQVSFLPALRPFGIVPNVALIVVAAAALRGPLVSAMVLALGAGFILDLSSGSDFGLKTGVLAFTVLICAFVVRSGFQLGVRSQLLTVVLIISTLMPLIVVPGLLFAGGRVDLATVISRWLTTLVLNSVLALVVGPFFARIAEPAKSYGG